MAQAEILTLAKIDTVAILQKCAARVARHFPVGNTARLVVPASFGGIYLLCLDVWGKMINFAE
ncbi:MAG: hypothetical protein ACI31E_06190 [Muribaculaceae bacterium]